MAEDGEGWPSVALGIVLQDVLQIVLQIVLQMIIKMGDGLEMRQGLGLKERDEGEGREK